jgi:hypothetical protein
MRQRLRVALLTVAAVAIVAGIFGGLKVLSVTVPGLVGVPTSAAPAPEKPPQMAARQERPALPGPWIAVDNGALSCCDTAGGQLDPPIPTVRCLPSAEYYASPRPAVLHYWVIPLKGSVPDPADPEDRPLIEPGETCSDD